MFDWALNVSLGSLMELLKDTSFSQLKAEPESLAAQCYRVIVTEHSITDAHLEPSQTFNVRFFADCC